MRIVSRNNCISCNSPLIVSEAMIIIFHLVYEIEILDAPTKFCDKCSRHFQDCDYDQLCKMVDDALVSMQLDGDLITRIMTFNYNELVDKFTNI